MHSRRVLCTGGSGFIGSHVLDHILARPQTDVLSIDIKAPGTMEHRVSWQMVDILDLEAVRNAVLTFEPTHVVHLAAKTDTDGKSIADYSANTTGTHNVLTAATLSSSLQKVVIASSQHVRRPGAGAASGDEDFEPYGAYGASKVVTERLVREARLACAWTIIRPTTVWGPGHWGLATGLWRTLARGLYVHPQGDPVMRSFGYVKNVARQIGTLLEAPADVVSQKVYYLGDPCIDELVWVNAFANAITGRPVRTSPRWALHTMALVGEAAHRLGVPSPIYLARFKNMVTSNVVPMEAALEELGVGPYSLQEGVEETVAWLRDKKLIDKHTCVRQPTS